MTIHPSTMNLQAIIDEFDAGVLTQRPDSVLEAARLEVEQAAIQAQFQPTLKPFRQTLYAIDSSITKTLNARYGCND